VKVPRDVSGAEAVRAFQRLGFAVVRQEGSHIRMGKAGIHITIPNHKEIAPKTLQTMLRQASVTLDEFRDAM
jgi:predicted RNA binding protein YcfA (HicA-like mRNA interferase family)